MVRRARGGFSLALIVLLLCTSMLPAVQADSRLIIPAKWM